MERRNILTERLKAVLAADQIVEGSELLQRYDHIWTMDEPTQALLALLPRSTAQVSEILGICNELSQPVVVHGGLTNLVGSTVARGDEVIVSLEKMNEIEEVDEASRTITVQAGVILEAVHEAAAQKGMLLPLSFGAKGTAQIGGIIASNAGGMRVLRFGMVRHMVLGLEAVLADGTIVTSMKKIIKDNSGYDLKQLFIGSEGTLGLVTRAVLKLVEMPMSRTAAIITCNKYEQVVQLLKYLDKNLAGTLSAFELMWSDTYRALTSPPSNPRPPIKYGYPFYILIEALGGDQTEDQDRMVRILEGALEKGLAADATPAQSNSDIRWFWSIREEVEGMTSLCRHNQQFDISLPIAEIGPYVESVISKLHEISAVERVFAFGHVADGNVHFIVGKSIQSESLKSQINEVVYQPIRNTGGSVSAEHGIGLDKKQYLAYARNDLEIKLMQQLKSALDPLNILNRGRVLNS